MKSRLKEHSSERPVFLMRSFSLSYLSLSLLCLGARVENIFDAKFHQGKGKGKNSRKICKLVTKPPDKPGGKSHTYKICMKPKKVSIGRRWVFYSGKAPREIKMVLGQPVQICMVQKLQTARPTIDT